MAFGLVFDIGHYGRLRQRKTQRRNRHCQRPWSKPPAELFENYQGHPLLPGSGAPQRTQRLRRNPVNLLRELCVRCGELRWLLAYSQLRQHECVIESNFLQVVISPRRSAVTGRHIGFQQQYVFIRLERA